MWKLGYLYLASYILVELLLYNYSNAQGSTHVLMVRNRLSRRFILYNGSNILSSPAMLSGGKWLHEWIPMYNS